MRSVCKVQSNFIFIFVSLVSALYAVDSRALPAFAMREKVSCNVCHSNGSAPHLTELGFMYRRAGFRFPANIGNKELDDANMEALKHFVGGVNVDYNVVTQKPVGGSEALVNNNFDVREVELYLVGAFFGNYATWSELDMTPGTAPATPSGASAAQTNASVALSLADLRYVSGDQNFYYSVRAGLIAPEGYGASDQWFDDGAIPLFDTLSALHSPGTGNQLDTLTIPFGAMGMAQMGAEFGVNWTQTFLTLGIYNGFDGSNGYTTQTQSTLSPAQMNASSKGSKDVKLQLDQFINQKFAVTAAYYNGRITLLDPTNTVPWEDSYQLGRVYGTYFLMPNVLDLMAGVSYGSYEFDAPTASTVAGHFNNDGAFVGASYYVKPHLTLGARVDYVSYDSTTSPSPRAQSATLLASLPYENNIWVFHFIRTSDDINGLTNDFRAEWRFLF